jgi:hypothetical protein
VQLVFVGKSFSDKLFVWAIVKDLPYHTNLGRESAAFGALGFFGGGGVLEIGSWGCHIAPRGRIGTQDDPYVVFRADSNGTGRASVGSPLVA